ncbi:sensor histidine kinase [Streptomyces qinglanensis]|uniref:histidine kinase n=1 Tax=Streptomyces qinglanensis TaxID=943816 RepID=A0A1H9NNH8_9ACTN|nr:sensor histidine kinase [Streptomyces qinglanensis]SER37498.1 Signal transduction histidine kinase [Streptomyces qinglanensis]
MRDRARGLGKGVRNLPRALREDLFGWGGTPRGRTESGAGSVSGWLIWRPIVVLVTSMVALVVAIFHINMLTGGPFRIFGAADAVLFGGAQAAALVLAVFRPVMAWWVVTVTMAVIALATGHAPPPYLRQSPWTVPEVVCQAGVLLLLALRRRPRAALGALLLTVLSGVLCAVANRQLLGPPAVRDFPVDVLVLTLAVVVGSALHGRQAARTELVVQEERTAEERTRRTLLEERNRIARELHDVVAHHMSVISIQAQAAPHLTENPSEELRESLAGIRHNAVEALAELRRVLGVLRSEDALTDRHAPQPTLERLPELVANVRTAGLTVTTRISGEPCPLAPGVELSVYRIVQEALSNVLRHAPGAEAEVEIGYRPTEVTVRVVNSGPVPGSTARAGAAPSAPGAGHGLPGMRERAAMLDGTLRSGATPDGGWRVVAALPLSSPSGAAGTTQTAETARSAETAGAARTAETAEDPS